MDIYQLIASWSGWPILVAVLLLLGGFAFWLLKNRLDYQKEINEQQKVELDNLKTARSNLKTSEKTILYGSIIGLVHETTSFCLHSHNRKYEHIGSSMQQQITAFKGGNKDDYWIVKGPHNFPKHYKKGETVKDKDIIRLEHFSTSKNLHSHKNRPSPMTSQQEVTGFGNDGEGNIDDNWKVEIISGGVWFEHALTRLIHQQTNAALHSHRTTLPDWAYNQQEVTCFKERNQDDLWKPVIYQGVNEYIS